MSTKILIVRHGETDWNREKIYRGVVDVPLNEHGRSQARLLAQALRVERIDAAYTSPLSRSAETAAIALEPHGMQAVPHEGLLDIDCGEWGGLPASEVAARWPQEHAKWITNPQTLRMPGGETLAQVFERAMAAMEALAEEHAQECVALFAHRVVNKLLILGALGLGLDRFPFILQGNCCINRLKRVEAGYLIECLNDTAHMKQAGTEVLKEDF